MGTTVRRNLSTKNRYYLTKHRRLELEHFCLQYHEWERELLSLNVFPVCSYQEVKGSTLSDPTTKTAMRALELQEKMQMVRKAANLVDISSEIFEAVTTGKTFSYFEANGSPFGRDLFYDRLRRFYYELDKIRR